MPNGIDVSRLRSVWDAFLAEDRVAPSLAHAPYTRSCHAAGSGSESSSFSSCQVLEQRHLEAGRQYFHFVYLCGSPDQCLQEYLGRLQNEGIISGPSAEAVDYWKKNNERLLLALEQPHNLNLAIPAFESDGSRRNPDAIYNDVLGIMGNHT